MNASIPGEVGLVNGVYSALNLRPRLTHDFFIFFILYDLLTFI